MNKPIAMRDALLTRIWKAMSDDPSIYFVTADFGSPVLDKIRADFPKRFVNVGIAEQNLINISAGLALEGFKVFAYAIAPFITMRAYEQIRVSLALMSQVREMNVNLIGVGAGYSYVVSGPTHQCYEDITLMRALPSFRVLSPADHDTADSLFDVCIQNTGPKYLRLDAQILPSLATQTNLSPNNGFRVLREGTDVCLISTGYMTHVALKVAERLMAKGSNCSVIDLIDITHFDRAKMEEIMFPYQYIATLEEGFKGRGGVDSLFLNFMNERSIPARYLNIGVKGGYQFELGTRSELHEVAGIGEDAVFHSLLNFVNKTYDNISQI